MIKLPDEISILGVSASLPDLFNSMRSDSLVEYTSVTRVEPIVLIENGLQAQNSTSDILQTLSSLFSGYYLQAVALSNTIGNISALNKLDKFNPNRNLALALGQGLEDMPLKIPKYTNSLESAYHVGFREVSMEATTKHKDTVDVLRNIDNLAVGKMLEVQLTDGEKSITIPISVRLLPLAIRADAFVSSFSTNSYKNTVKERFYRWRAGELSLIGDIIFCNDIVDAHRKNMLNDKSGFYAHMVGQRRKNMLSAIASMSPSVASASTMAVVTDDTVLKLERELGGKLDNAAFRNKTLFGNSSLMLLVVVEQEWERVKIYHRGIKTSSDLSFRDLRAANKNTGPDVAEIMKAYQLATAPTI